MHQHQSQQQYFLVRIFRSEQLTAHSPAGKRPPRVSGSPSAAVTFHTNQPLAQPSMSPPPPAPRPCLASLGCACHTLNTYSSETATCFMCLSRPLCWLSGRHCACSG